MKQVWARQRRKLVMCAFKSSVLVPKNTHVMRATRRPRTVGLDKPCRSCGKPVHYTYAATGGGLCGRCADRRRPKRARGYHRGTVVERGGSGRRSSPAAIAAKLIVVVVLGGAAVMVALRYLMS
jgi:hypothetical protein